MNHREFLKRNPDREIIVRICGCNDVIATVTSKRNNEHVYGIRKCDTITAAIYGAIDDYYDGKPPADDPAPTREACQC